MDVRVAILKEFEIAPGTTVNPREVRIVSSYLAEQWVSEGKACYYSDFTESMLDSRETRVVETPQNAAESTEAPSGKTDKGRKKRVAESTEAKSEEAETDEEAPEAKSEEG